MPKPQSFQSHARVLPPYHYVVGPILLLNLMSAVVQLIRGVSSWSVLGVLMGVALIILYLFARLMVLTVQDRVIRLEERLRLAELLPPDLKGRIGELKTKQLVALRFASDAEVAELVREVLTKNITDQKTIKSMVKDWRADHLRA